MKYFTYEALPGRVVFAPGALSRLPDEIDRLQKQRALLIATNSAAPFVKGIAGRLGARLAGVFREVEQHVPAATVQRALAVARQTGVDCVVVLGGGSAIGLGKALAREIDLAIIAVPTTFSGSEMTPIYGITDEGRKQTGRDLRVLPRTVIYDPELLYSLPLPLAATSGLNALAHCVEALYSNLASPMTDLMAEEGSRALAQGLLALAQDTSNHEGYDLTLYGAYLAGCVLGLVGTGLHHRICHILGGSFHLPHAETHSIILPHVVHYNRDAAPEAMARLAHALGASNAAQGIVDLAVRLPVPKTLATLGLHADQLEEAARLVVASPPWNPRPITLADMQQLLQAAYHGPPAL
jgi:maleylacetate reductase